MALGPCHECGQQVSDQATACPRCGAPTEAQAQRQRFWVDVRVFLIIGLLLAAFVGGGLYLKHRENQKAERQHCEFMKSLGDAC